MGSTVILVCIGVIILLIAILWVVGWTAPVNRWIPFLITLNRPELRPFCRDLLKGNEWGYACSPMTAQLGLPATGADCAFGLQALSRQARSGKAVFYQVYSPEARAKDPDLERVGIYCLPADSGEKNPYVAMIAGGGFTAVCTLWESLPVSASFQQMGYTSFCIQYRTGTKFGEVPATLMEDIAACISYINRHAEQFNVQKEGYLLGGFSAGSKAVSMWANEYCGYASYGLPKPGAVCLIYGAKWDCVRDGYRVPTFCRYCLHDRFNKDTTLFTDLQDRLSNDGIPNAFKCVDAGHGFGLGSKSEAEGWTEEAKAFWERTF